MARRTSFDDKVARIHEIGRDGDERAAPELARYLTETNSYLVGEAARSAAKLEFRQLAPDLAAAFERMRTAQDQGCRAKMAIVEALITLEADCLPVYYAGLKLVQLEPKDVAGGLRALCAHALVRLDVPGAAFDVAPLLFDPEPLARIGAADALGQTGAELCAAIVHARVLAGERNTDVLAACYKTMLSLSPKRYLPIVGEALVSGEEAAALALGESRISQALPYFKQALALGGSDIEDVTLLGVALLRQEEATDFLLDCISTAPESRAALAIGALALHRHDTKLYARAEEIVKERGSRKLSRVFAEKFGQS